MPLIFNWTVWGAHHELKNPRNSSSRGFGRRSVSLLHDDAVGEVVRSDREIDEADAEENDDGFHDDPPFFLFFLWVICIVHFLFLVCKTGFAGKIFQKSRELIISDIKKPQNSDLYHLY